MFWNVKFTTSLFWSVKITESLFWNVKITKSLFWNELKSSENTWELHLMEFIFNKVADRQLISTRINYETKFSPEVIHKVRTQEGGSKQKHASFVLVTSFFC